VKKSQTVRFMRRSIMLLLATAGLAAASATSAFAAESQTFTFTGQGGGDSSTCGPDWANDTYTRVFKVFTQKTVSQTSRVEEKFTNGHFTTLQGPSPESCEAGDSNKVSANVTGNFHGQEVIYFYYHTANKAACGNTWTNAATGNGGDIATICQP
jgi:hypothetical protein